MMKDNFYIETYEKYREELNKSDFHKELQIIAYDTIKKPESNEGVIWIYAELLSEHTRQLANDINTFRRNLIKLNTWSKIIIAYNENEKLNLIVEFIEPILVLIHDFPYSTNNRFIFALSHLCHQANRYILDEWKDDLPQDSKIKYKTMIKYCSNWTYCSNFLLSLKELSGENYLIQTNEYRNRLHHRIPIQTEIGLSSFMTRNINKNKKVSYSLGYIEPFTLNETVHFMTKQHSIMCKCFLEYENLLNHQIKKIDKVNN